MASNKEALDTILFGDAERELVNLKLMRGDSPDFSERALCGEIHSALFQIKSGQSKSSKLFSDHVGDSQEFNLAELAGK